jgi:hypothetical protein
MKSIVNIQEKLEDGTELYGWKSEPPLTPFAPNYVHYITDKKIFNGAECESWFRYLLEQEPILLDKFRVSAGNGGTGLSENSLTSRYPYFNVLKFNFHLVSKLKTLIFNGIKTILSVSGNTNWQETLYANCWYNVLRQGESMQTHHHSYHKNSFYGFHLTINAIETFTSYYHPIKFQEEAFHTPNKIGYLTLFPNFIPHSVSLNRYETPRISIAGDIFPSSWLDESGQAEIQGNLVEIGNL